MDEPIKNMLSDGLLVKKIQEKLPKLFHIAELETSRAGKVGMEVGSLRERIIVALFIYYFGEDNIETEIPITEPEVDVKVFKTPVSIKTLTSSGLPGFKIIWTVDAESANNFRLNYSPTCDIIFVRINWNNEGDLYYFPLHAQTETFTKLGRNEYIKLPKAGTNPRGVEISTKALRTLVNHPDIIDIKIKWQRHAIDFNTFNRWVEMWQQD